MENINENEKNLNVFSKHLDFQVSKTLVKDSFTQLGGYSNSFNLFLSIDNIAFLIYSNINKSIITFDLIAMKKLCEIKNAHKENISNFRHYSDLKNNRDLILSISTIDNNIKLWNLKNLDCLLNLPNINKKGFLHSSCFLNNDNQIYIITSNCLWHGNCENLKVYDLNGNKI